MQIRKNKTDYYAKTTAMDGVYKLQSDIGNAVDKNARRLPRQNSCSISLANTPEKIEMHDGQKTYLFEPGRRGLVVGREKDGRCECWRISFAPFAD